VRPENFTDKTLCERESPWFARSDASASDDGDVPRRQRLGGLEEVPAAMCTNAARPGFLFAAISLLWTSGALADTATFRQGVGGYAGAKDIELRGGKAAPGAPAKAAPKKKAGTRKKDAEATKKKKESEAPEAPEASISVDLDNDGVQSQALIRFDDIIGAGPGQIPPGSTVTAAILTVRGHDAGAGKIYVHRVLADWDPSRITWDTAKLAGNTEGGIQADDKEAAAAFGSFESDRTGDFEIDVLPAVKLWVAGTAKNHGLALTSDSTNGWDFYSSRAKAVDRRPKLTITFTPPAAR
jgi:hypothetical protein